MAKAGKPTSDLIDRLRSEWKQEEPDLDTRSMEVVGRIMLLARQWDSQLATTLKTFDLAYTDFDIIATLCRSGSPYELTPTQLLQSVLLTSGAMTTALTRLQNAGLLVRTADANDGRSKKARLTRKGLILARKSAQKRFEVATSQVKQLSVRAKGELATMLKHLLQET